MTRRAFATVAAIALALAIAPPSAAADGEATLRRLAGVDRFATAALVAGDGWASASDAVLARADDPVDALAGSYVAGSHLGPVLLAEHGSVPQVTIDRLRQLQVHKVRVLGGEAALGSAVVSQLQQLGFTVERIAGDDRYATAAAVARNSGAANVGVRGSRGATAILASGILPADALAAGPLAYGQQWPILLTGAGSLPAATRSALDDLAVRHVLVVGGTAAVSAAAVAELEASGRTVERIAGADRSSTATAIADLLVGLGAPLTTVEVASGTSFADALALGPHAAPASPVLLCVALDHCGAATLDWVRAHAADVDELVVAGGTAAVGPTAASELLAAAG